MTKWDIFYLHHKGEIYEMDIATDIQEKEGEIYVCYEKNGCKQCVKECECILELNWSKNDY